MSSKMCISKCILIVALFPYKCNILWDRWNYS